MAGTVLMNVRLFAGAVDLTGVSNKVELTSELEEKDVTAFRAEDDPAAGWKEVLGGLASTSITAAGQWEAGDPGKVDDATWEALSTRSRTPWSVCPVSAGVGDLAYFTGLLRTTYALGDAVGEVAPWEAEGAGDGLLVRGVVMHPPGTARTTPGSGTALELGALAAGQRVHAALHVLSVAGDSPELVVEVESAADEEFTSPTTQATFTTADASSGRAQMVTASGPVTDTWWRVSWTVSGDDPSFLFIATLGIV